MRLRKQPQNKALSNVKKKTQSQAMRQRGSLGLRDANKHPMYLELSDREKESLSALVSVLMLR